MYQLEQPRPLHLLSKTPESGQCPEKKHSARSSGSLGWFQGCFLGVPENTTEIILMRYSATKNDGARDGARDGASDGARVFPHPSPSVSVHGFWPSFGSHGSSILYFEQVKLVGFFG